MTEFAEIQLKNKFVIRDEIGLVGWSQMMKRPKFQNEELFGLPVNRLKEKL